MNVHSMRDWEERFGGSRPTGVHYLQSTLKKTDKGAPLNTIANIMLIMAHDPALAGMLGHNEFTSQSLMMRPAPPAEDGQAMLPGPYPRGWGVEDVALVQAYIQRMWIPKATRQAVEDGMMAEAAHRRFHPIRDWLGALRWDGVQRLDTWLCKAFGCPDDAYHRAIGSKFLIAAVRRVRQPGCKFDHMPVLEGDQGIGKSTACARMFGRENFSDAIPEELASRDAALALLGVWALEFAEIQHLIRNEVEVIKAFLSRSTDRYRPPYGKSYVERPRQGVLIGTTNTTDYLRDTSGNRRIWPVRCFFADVDWIDANREQVWAEAAAREASGEAIWLHEEDARCQAAQEQSDRMSEDLWADLVRDYVETRVEVRTHDVLTTAIGIPRERQGKREEMRVGAVMTAMGWERKVQRVPGAGPTRFWVRKGR